MSVKTDLIIPLLLLAPLACGDDSTETGASAGETSSSTGVAASGSSSTSGGASETDSTAGPGGTGSMSETGGSTTETTMDVTAGGVCGDGTVDAGEECDEGDDNGPGGACLDGCVVNVCGDDDKGPGEECDDGGSNHNNGVCKEDCTLNVCGDGFDGPDEGCDDGNDVDDDACTNACAVQTCGNGVLDPGEECDDGNDVDEDACTNTCVPPPSPCGTQDFEATLEISPVDVIFVIDNSGSMGQEIKGVQDNINVNFANIIKQSGLDYRVIMVSQHGAWNGPESICIEEPLSGIQAGGCDNPPNQPVNNPPIFYHYSTPIGSHNAWCKLIEHFPLDAQDEFGQTGYLQWLRDDSIKTFIGISDDGINCSYSGHDFDDNDNVNDGVSEAMEFDAALLGLSEEQFGTAEDRRYSYYSIVGVDYNDPPDAPYTPDDPILTADCPSAADPGTGHQALSVQTNALRFPLCDTTSYDVVFQAIAQGVIEGSSVACEFPVPVPPDEQELDLSSIEIFYTPMGMGDAVPFEQVPGPEECGPDKFYILGDTVFLCPEACDLVQGDFDAQIDLEYQCLPDIG